MKKKHTYKSRTSLSRLNLDRGTVERNIGEKIYAKKSLGQNFLKSEGALKKIITGGNVTKKDTVLEIGPGHGALTKKLLETGAKVVAIEKDRELISELQETFKEYITKKQLVLIEGDILNIDIAKLKLGTYKLIANIPYYITGEIFRLFLEETIQPKTIVVLIQKEVAERIMAKDKKQSILALSVHVYGEPSIVSIVPRGAFVPSPNVDSAILVINNISKKYFKDKGQEKTFFTLIRKGFSHKRKRLYQNIKDIFPKMTEESFQNLGFNKNARAEDLKLEDWFRFFA